MKAFFRTLFKVRLSQQGVITVLPLVILVILLVGIVIGVRQVQNRQQVQSHAQALTPTCGLTNPAFCDTFDQPMGTGNRAGQLNGIVWGVSRSSASVNPSQHGYDGWFQSTASECNTQPLNSPNDVQICNGELVESVNDGGPDIGLGQAVLGMYPKQPLDIANRIGKVTFDVGDDTGGSHQAWPEFVFSDQPSPNPYGMAAALTPFARNSFGFDLAGICGTGGGGCQNISPTVPSGQQCVTVGGAFITANYAITDLYEAGDVTHVNCVVQPTATQIAAGQLNHFEVDFLPSGNEVDVYGTDPGGAASTQRLIAKITNFTLPLSRGFIWMEDAHYNACKYGATQCDHSFVWDNIGFDGPVFSRDLDVEVPDALTIGNSWDPAGKLNLGYSIPPNGAGNPAPTTLTFAQPVAANMLSASSGALLTFNYSGSADILYSINHGPTHTFTWPTVLGNDTSEVSFGIPIALSEVQAGTNTVTFSTASQFAVVANVDLKLVGAGGVPCAPDPSEPCNGSPLPTPSSTVTPTATPSGKIGDFNGDGSVDVLDLSILLANWNTTNAQTDLNHDGATNVLDFSILLSHWGS